MSPGAGRRGVVKDTQGRDRKRRLGGSHFASAHIRLLRAQLTATGNGFDVGTERDLVGDAQSPAPRNARPRAAGQQAVLAGCPLPFPAASWPRPSPPCPQQLPLPSAAWTVLLRPPNSADALPCPLRQPGGGTGTTVSDAGPFPPASASPSGHVAPRHHLGPTSHVEGHAEAPLLADIQTVLKVTLRDTSPGANKSTPCLFYRRPFLSASVTADCI